MLVSIFNSLSHLFDRPSVTKHVKILFVNFFQFFNVVLAEHWKVFGSQLVRTHLRYLGESEYDKNNFDNSHPFLSTLVPYGRNKSLPPWQLLSQPAFFLGQIFKMQNHVRTKGARGALRPCWHPMVVPPGGETWFAFKLQFLCKGSCRSRECSLSPLLKSRIDSMQLTRQLIQLLSHLTFMWRRCDKRHIVLSVSNLDWREFKTVQRCPGYTWGRIKCGIRTGYELTDEIWWHLITATVQTPTLVSYFLRCWKISDRKIFLPSWHCVAPHHRIGRSIMMAEDSEILKHCHKYLLLVQGCLVKSMEVRSSVLLHYQLSVSGTNFWQQVFTVIMFWSKSPLLRSGQPVVVIISFEVTLSIPHRMTALQLVSKSRD